MAEGPTFGRHYSGSPWGNGCSRSAVAHGGTAMPGPWGGKSRTGRAGELREGASPRKMMVEEGQEQLSESTHKVGILKAAV